MPTKTVVSTRQDSGLGYMYPAYQRIATWQHSPVVNGQRILKANTLSTTETRALIVCAKRGQFADQPAIFGVSAPGALINDASLLAGCTNRAFGKLASAVRGENSSLGITAATWRQSWLMIAKRATQITDIAKRAKKRAERENAKRAKKRKMLRSTKNALFRLAQTSVKDLQPGKPRRVKRRPPPGATPRDLLPVGSANIFLEGIFGWSPLLGDIHAAAKTLAAPIPSGDWMRFSASDSSSKQGLPPGITDRPWLKWSSRTKCRVTMACKVRIDNPNVWLLNKLGLINPALVAWDLIPWSFVVGFFGNVGQVLGSYTAFAGLTLSDASTTTKWETTETWSCDSWNSIVTPKPPASSMNERGTVTRTTKSRSLGLSPPTLRFRAPTLEMTSALIALSLMAQQVGSLDYFKPSKRK